MNHLSSLFIVMLPVALSAQCPFTATIVPVNPILCPGESVELSTEVYDSYQWYVDGQMVDGATGPTFTAQPYAEVTVEVTLDGCTEMSMGAIVDGWVFVLPFVETTGAPPLFTDGNGVQHFCEGDTVLLIMSYSENVQWTNNGVNVPGGTDDTLVVMTDGLYNASGAPSTCPNFIQFLGVDVPIVFENTIQPEILLTEDQLCASPQGDAYQWFLNGAPLAGTTACISATAEGSYTVDVTYDGQCSVPSTPYLTTSVHESGDAGHVLIFPVPARDAVNIKWPANAANTTWELMDAVGRVVLHGAKGNGPFQRVDLGSIQQGRYWLRTNGHVPQVVQVVK